MSLADGCAAGRSGARAGGVRIYRRGHGNGPCRHSGVLLGPADSDDVASPVRFPAAGLAGIP
jgi:hypothetical protein